MNTFVGAILGALITWSIGWFLVTRAARSTPWAIVKMQFAGFFFLMCGVFLLGAADSVDLLFR